MSAALARRDDGCASDLLMDRWLLGELPGSDEGRRFEQHVRECTGCAARFQALRSLYGNRPAPKAEAPLPPLSAPPPVLPPEHAAVLQVIILRDGLLVGTEVFTAGRYTVGSAPTCALKLDDVATVHAAVSLRGERVGLEAAGGQVFVNGFRVGSCELRPIDEVAVGPYVLRTRVIAERWARPQLRVVRDEREAADAKVAPAALKLSLYWGDTLLEVRVLDAPADLKDFGIHEVLPIDGGWQLDGLRVAHGEVQRFHVGHLVCVAETVARAQAIRRGPVRQWPWTVISLAAALYAGVLALGVHGSGLDHDTFVPKPIPGAVVHMVAPPKPNKPVATAVVRTPQRRESPPRILTPPARGGRVKLPQLGAVNTIVAALDRLGPAAAAGKSRGTRAVLVGLGNSPLPSASGLGLRSDGPGIGASGLKGAGGFATRNFGKGAVGGTVGAPRARDVRGDVHVDRDAIAKVINEHLSEVSRCYEQAMLHGGSFGGRMLLEWTIAAPGNVQSARVKNTDIDNETFGACVLGRLKTWRFPAMRGAAQVSYPFIVRSVGY